MNRWTAHRRSIALLLGMAGILAGAAHAVERVPFTVVALPDTQRYSERLPGSFLAQTGWIVAMRERESIAFVTHLGDLVEHHADRTEWERADRAMRTLDGIVPFSACIGNHDAGSANCTEFFGTTRHAGQPGYVGSSPDGRNHAMAFTASGYRFLHLNFVYAPGEPALAWARTVVAATPDSPVIVSTHDNLGLFARTTNGEALWSRFVTDVPQVFLVLNGHTHGEYWQVSANSAGGRVIEILSDYQDNANGGEGDLRLLRFDVPRNRLEIETYSPVLDRWSTNETSRFGFDVEFGKGVVVQSPVGRQQTVAPNRHAGKPMASAAVPPPALELPPPEAGCVRLRFRPGMDGYAGATAVELSEAKPDAGGGQGPSFTVDRDDPSGSGKRTQALLRFDGIAGAASNQVPASARIVAARLALTVTDDGSGFTLHRLLLPWATPVSWTSLANGVSADDAEAVAVPDQGTGADDARANVRPGRLVLEVTDSVRRWQAGSTNAGWLLQPWPTGSNGVDVASPVATDASQRPELVIDYHP